MRISVIIPTYRSERVVGVLLDAIRSQTPVVDEILVIDSNSPDQTVSICEARHARVYRLGGRKFDHGGTRQLALDMVEADVAIYLTHDAVPADRWALAKIVAALYAAPDIGMAYGRQLAVPGAGPFARHHRAFNYPAQNSVKRLADSQRLGVKAPYASDSFCAYKVEVLREIGGFPLNTICCEDVHVGARMLLAGFAISYVADACVYHSHDYSAVEEFKRYFDNGVFYGREAELMSRFSATAEGLRYLKSELKFLVTDGEVQLLPLALLRTALKAIAFKLGHFEGYLPRSLKRHISLYAGYWT